MGEERKRKRKGGESSPKKMGLNWSKVIAAIVLVNNNRGCLSEGGETITILYRSVHEFVSYRYYCIHNILCICVHYREYSQSKSIID